MPEIRLAQSVAAPPSWPLLPPRPPSEQPAAGPGDRFTASAAVVMVAQPGMDSAEAPAPSLGRSVAAGFALALSLLGMAGCGASQAPPPAASLTKTVPTKAEPSKTVRAEDARLFGVGGSLLPDNAGRIQHMAFQYGNVEFDKPLPQRTRESLQDMYRTLFLNMSPDTRFTVVTANAQGEAEIRALVERSGMPNPERVNVVNLKSEKGISIWIRDSMFPVQREDGAWKILIQDRTYWPGPEDNRVPTAIDTANQDIEAVPHPALRIDGGNAVSTRRWAYIGNDSFQHTTDRLRELSTDPVKMAEIVSFYEARTGRDVVEHPSKPGEVSVDQMWTDIAPEVFKSEFKREIFMIGVDDPATPIRETQPVFHIDMSLTPLANGKFLVGDPQMALDALKALSPSERSAVNSEMAAEAGLDPSKDLVGDLIEVNTDATQQANFDNVARQMREAGHEVIRVPFLTGVRTTWRLPYLTYNNSLQEAYTDASGREVRKIYLPVYGVKPLDEMATRIYESQGYEVVPLHMAGVSILEGAIRCSAYPIQRTEVPYR